MKSLKMSKVFSTIKRRNTSGLDVSTHPNDTSPEAVAARSVRSFCESSGPNSAEDEIIYLPSIVESAESSPSAAKQCADMIREYLKKDYITRPDFQYNALMLVRILADNPGPTFTRNLDQEFAKTTKELLKSARNEKVRQMLMETLTSFETTKFYDEGLTPLIEMWKKEKEKAAKSSYGVPIQSYLRQRSQQPSPQGMPMMTAPVDRHSQNYFARNHSSRRLPEPVELASRLEEARTSAGLLQQVVTNTPPGEIIGNDLIKEFAERLSLDERQTQTNEGERGLSRRHSPPDTGLGISTSSGSRSKKPAAPPRETNGKGKGREYEPLTYAGSSAGPSRSRTPLADEDPFRDPEEQTSSNAAGGSSSRYLDQDPKYAFEPFHPGFNSTPSYAGRQDSAVGKEAMHGAVETSSGGKAAGTPPAARRADSSDNDSLYDAPPPNQKEPIYRY
ncbi:hypothetical protein NUW58_g1751 [Xylaria curta]|uniref:Uncharacterized protein n=1 Tax=Xylaria curta TaxID=42375 RepID=A0ACC1PIR8_9PEZI|nr:hypothetical protein NUW58_g1751 [Xylaria curta]